MWTTSSSIVTDGITEAIEDAGDARPEHWLAAIVADAAEGSAASLRDRILTQIGVLTAGEPAADDRTLVVVRVNA